jgi:protein SCO1/2
MTLKRGRILVLAASVLAGVAAGYGIHLAFFGGDAPPRESRSFGEALIGGPFTLTDQDGRRRSDAEFRGRLMLVEFGYTNCPDVCPLGLQLMADAMERLGADADKVQPIFITVDPGRDTPEVLKSYVDHFSERLLGLTGASEEIAAVARAYRVYYKLHGDPAASRDYVVDHSGFIYLMGRDGKFLAHFTHETPPDRIADAIRRSL